MSKQKKVKKKTEFSKWLLKQESMLIWIVTLVTLFLSYICIINDYNSSLPWLATLISSVWAAYGVSQCFYYNKAKNENTKNGIKYETVMAELENYVEEEESIGDIDINYGI